MEKEQKKLLLVAVSTGVFLLVTIAVAIIMLTPKIQPQESVFSSTAHLTGTTRSAETANETSSKPVINNSQETKIYIDGNPEPIAIDKNNGDSLTIQIPKPSTPAVPDDISASSAAKTPAVTAVKPAASQPAKAQVSTAGKAVAAKKTAAASSSGKTAGKTINDYWIQTGAYSSMVRAEDVKERLSSNGLTSIIENREVDGKILYRVRLGPYTSENEANYWLTLVKSIDNFGDSQVRQTVRQQ
jgi:DedD protein